MTTVRNPALGVLLFFAAILGIARTNFAADAPAETDKKPVVAFFPIGGDADESLRERTAFSFRQKLDKTKLYEVIDGYAMADLMAEESEPITSATSVETIRKLAGYAKADIAVWGDLSGKTLKVKLLDVADPEAKPREMNEAIPEQTDLRFAIEKIIETLPGVQKHEHVTEVAVQADPKADELFKNNPNLLKNGTFDEVSGWDMIYLMNKYQPPFSNDLPAEDKVVIYRLNEDGKTNNVLAMNLSRFCAENPGMACLSKEFAIEPNTRYRIVYRYRSDAPILHTFVKGYTMGKNVKGEPALREVYKRQVPPSEATDGKWVEIVDEFNPQHVEFPVQYLKVDLYAYLNPGLVMFDDVVVKAVGEQNRHAKDEAIKPNATQPSK